VRIQAPGPWTPATPEPDRPEEEEVPEVFEVTFHIADPTVERMTVSCHQGGEVTGAEALSLPEAGKGPCRMTAERPTGAFTTTVSLTGPHSYVCFEHGSRRCR
jgi:hypothetical protein